MLPGDRMLGHYHLIQRIGSGGMGEVYLAEDTRIAHRQVAIKVVRAEADPYPDPVALQDATRLFQREMRAIIMLDHPYILPLFDFGDEKTDNITTTYMVMPFRQEGSLSDWLQKRESTEKLTANEVAHFIEQAADALQHAHDHGLVHQDIKPSNFLIRSRSNNKLPDLLLTDFGIAKINSATATASQNIRGTPAFMAPEQWEGNPQPATDQYALAIMAYLLLTGRTPFTGRMEQVMRQHFMTQPQPPSSHNPDIPPALDAIILRALEKEPDKRFPSISEFAQEFLDVIQSNSKQGAGTITPKVEEASSKPEEGIKDQKGNPPDNSAPVSPLVIHSSEVGKLPSSVTPPHPALPIRDDTVLFVDPNNSKSETLMSPPLSQPLPHVGPVPETGKLATSTKKARWKVLAIIGLILLVIASSIIGITTYQNHVNIINNPYPSYLAGNGTLALIDPLSTENKWSTYNSGNEGNCQFTNSAYHISQSPTGFFVTCSPDGTFSNFAFEVHMTIIQGDCGGIVFRQDISTGQKYYFHVCQDGSYKVMKYMDNSGANAKVMQDSTSSSINIGYNQQNTLAVVAKDSTITLYINQQQVDQEQDSSYTEGSIGLIAYPYFGNATEVAYSNARVWTF